MFTWASSMFTWSVPTVPWPPWCGLSIGLLERAKSGGLFGKPSISLRTSWATWCATKCNPLDPAYADPPSLGSHNFKICTKSFISKTEHTFLQSYK
ncbi:hypothetical protein GQ457_01G035380 [Hibiscus cannabinus]